MTAPRPEHGLVLVVTLVMLTLVTLMASASANLIMANMRVVQNIEARSAVRSAALAAMQEAIATPGFLPPYAAGQIRRAFSVSCKGDLYARCLDLSGDEIEDDVTVTMTAPKCLSFVLIPNRFFNYLDNPDDRQCQVVKQRYSACGNALFEVTATAVDDVTGARVEIRQGISRQTTAQAVKSICPNNKT
jgi:hypothetical protein